MLNDAQTQTVQALAQMSAGVLKMGQELKTRLAAAPKAVDAEVLEKCAQAMIDSGWIDAARKPQLLDALSDPTKALETLAEVATKSAEAIDGARNNGADPRLGNGTPVPHGDRYVGAKKASVEDEEPEHARAFLEKMTAYRAQLANG